MREAVMARITVRRTRSSRTGFDMARVYSLYNSIVARLPPDLRSRAPPLEIARRHYSRYIAHYYKYRRGSKIVEKIRVDPRAVAKLSDRELAHLLAHELAHFVLEARGDRVSNMLHTGKFYHVLAEIAGYPSPREAEEADERIRLKYEEKIGEETIATRRRKKEKKTSSNQEKEPKVKEYLSKLDMYKQIAERLNRWLRSRHKHTGTLHGKARLVSVILDIRFNRRIPDIESLARRIIESVESDDVKVTGCAGVPKGLSCDLAVASRRGNPYYKHIWRIEDSLARLGEELKKQLPYCTVTIEVWKLQGAKTRTDLEKCLPSL